MNKTSSATSGVNPWRSCRTEDTDHDLASELRHAATTESLEGPVVHTAWLSWARRLLPIVALLLLVGVLASPSGRVAVKCLAILPEIFPNSPVRPLLLVTSPPKHRELSWESPAGRVDADLYLPSQPGPHGGIVLVTGVFGARGADNLVRLADALARSGALVLVPESESLQSGNIQPEEVTALVQALEVLHDQPEADRSRIGLAGFSVGGSLALLAAEDDRGRELASFVNMVGSYFDAKSTLIAVASREIEVNGVPTTWAPDRVADYTFRRHLIEALPEETDRVLLWNAFPDDGGQGRALEPGELTRDAEVVFELLSGVTRARAMELMPELPSGAQTWLDSISPARGIGNVDAALYVMHDQSDAFIPFTESRQLVMAAPSRALRRYTETGLFKHVTPDLSLPPTVFVLEVWKFFAQVWAVGAEFL